MNIFTYLVRRTSRRWQILLTIILGVISATGLLSSGPLLVNTVMDFALPYKLRSVSPLESNLRLTTYDMVDLASYQELDSRVRARIDEYLGSYTGQIVSSVASAWAYPWQLEQILPDQRVNLRTYEGIAEKVEFIEGDWPQGDIYQDNTVAVVISESFAEAYGLVVGDLLPLSFDERETAPSLWFQVTGIIRPQFPREPYWFGEFSPLRDQADQRWNAQHSAILLGDALFPIHKALFSKSRMELNWNVLIDPTTVQVKDVPTLQVKVAELRMELKDSTQRINLESYLEDVLAEFITQSRVVRVTLYVLLVEVLFLALYYITMVVSLSAQQVEGEFTALASRGTSFSQLFTIQGTEAGLIGILAFLSGPGLACFVVWGLSKIGPMADVSQNDWTLRLPHSSWLGAGIGAMVCILGLLFPVRSVMQRSVVAYTRRTSRSNLSTWWQRLYLDVFALMLGLILWWRLNLHGGLATSDSGMQQVDWLLLLSPVVLLVGSATILLRLYPWLLRIGERLLARARGLPAVLALWQVARNPTDVARLVLLLTLAMALGTLSTGLNVSLNLSEYERALHATGSDLRLSFDRYTPESQAEKHTIWSGVKGHSTIWRGKGSISIRVYRTYPTFDVLAIEPYEFTQVSRFRYDYADRPIGQLLGYLTTDPEQNPDMLLHLPGEPSHLGVWVLENQIYGQRWETKAIDYLYLRAKLGTAQDDLFLTNLNLVPLSGDENQADTPAGDQDTQPLWRYFEARLPTLPAEAYPLYLHSFWLSMYPMGDQTRYRLSFILDDFLVKGSETEEAEIFEDFESLDHIWMLNDTQYSARFSRREEAHSGSGSISIDMPGTPNPRGLALLPARQTHQDPLAALVSEELISMTQTEVGDTVIGNISGIPLPIKINGVLRYFPTLYDEPGHGFMVVQRAPLLAKLNREIRNPVNINEVWIDVETPRDAASLVGEFPNAVQVWDLDDERRAIKAEPLSLGLRSVIYLGYYLTAILSLVGFATHFYLSARQREVSFSILRSLGLSPVQLYGSLLLEQIVVVTSGLTVGTILGVLLNRLVLPGLPMTTGGRYPIPPFLVYTDWSSMLRLYFTLLGAFLLVLGGATATLWRAQLHRVLRIGQE